MSCENVRAQVAAGLAATEIQEAFGVHLRQCSACGDLVDGLATVSEMRAQWQEEPVPKWDRLRHQMPRRQPRPWLTIGLPLAACLVLALLVMMRAELTVDQGGWSLSFAGTAREQAMLDKVRTLVAEERKSHNQELVALLDEYDKRQRNVTQNLLGEYDQRQSLMTEQRVAQVAQAMRDDQAISMKTLVGAIKSQREQDLLWVRQNLENVVLRQERTHSNLNKLASYVARDDAR